MLAIKIDDYDLMISHRNKSVKICLEESLDGMLLVGDLSEPATLTFKGDNALIKTHGRAFEIVSAAKTLRLGYKISVATVHQDELIEVPLRNKS